MHPSQGNYLQSSRNFLDRDQLALPCPGTTAPRRFPRPRRCDVALPKRPCPALPRSVLINGAAAPTVEEDAVAVRLLTQRDSARRFLRIDREKLVLSQFDESRDGRDFFVIEPNISWFAGATIAAARAFEAQAIAIPNLFAARHDVPDFL